MMDLFEEDLLLLQRPATVGAEGRTLSYSACRGRDVHIGTNGWPEEGLRDRCAPRATAGSRQGWRAPSKATVYAPALRVLPHAERDVPR